MHSKLKDIYFGAEKSNACMRGMSRYVFEVGFIVYSSISESQLQSKRERERDFPFSDLLPRQPQWLAIHSGLLCGWYGPRYLDHLPLLYPDH